MVINKKGSKILIFFILEITLLPSEFVQTVFEEEVFFTSLKDLDHVANFSDHTTSINSSQVNTE